MWQSLKEYALAMGRWGWVVLGDVLGGGIGAYLDISGKLGFPTWVWLAMLVLGLAIAPFIAFHKVRIQRDAALEANSNTVATRIVAVSNYSYHFQTLDDSLRLRLQPEIHAIPAVRVEDIQLEMKGKRYETSWKPMDYSVSGDIGEAIYVDLPKSLKFGAYKSRIVAIIGNREYYSEFFDLDYRKSNLGK